jgi:type II secretory pathway component GspD/PulD (secretin)/tetratricopeptide (TPR) repeat protein
MRTCRHRRINRTVIAAGLTVSSFLIISTPNVMAADADVSTTLTRGAELLQQGHLLQSKRLLAQIERGELEHAQRMQLGELLKELNQELSLADSNDLSLQKAQLAVVDGNLRLAEKHATAVRDSRFAGIEHVRQAELLLTQISEARDQLLPQVRSLIDDGVAAVRRGDLATAKATFELLYDSGVALTPKQESTLFANLGNLLELDIEQGAALHRDRVLAAMYQPGRVVHRDEPVGQPVEEPAEEPVAEPETTEPVVEPVVPPVTVEPEPEEPSIASDDLMQRLLQIEAAARLDQANQAYEGGRYQEAIDKYGSLASGQLSQFLTVAELEHVRNRLALAQAKFDEGPLIGETVEAAQIARQTAIDEFARRMEEARDALNNDETDEAMRLTRTAEDGWRRSEDSHSEPEFEEGLSRVLALRNEIRDRQAQMQDIETSQRIVEQASDEAVRISEAARQRRDEINQALDRVQALEAEQKYDEALQVLETILFLDPGNPTAELLKRLFADIVLYRRWAEFESERPRSYQEEFVNMTGSLVVPQEILDYPEDWPELSRVRGIRAAYVAPEEDRRVAHLLDTQRLPFQFDDNMLEAVVQYVQNLTPGVAINVDWAALEQAGVERDEPVTLSLVNVPVRVGLERILEQLNTGVDDFSRIWYSIRDGIITISLDSELRKFTVPIVYDIRDLLINIPDHDDAPDLNLQTALQQSRSGGGGGGGGNIFGGTGGGAGADPDAPTEEELTDELIELVMNTIDREGWLDNGGDTGTIVPLRGNLIITQTPENHLQIEGLLSQLREIRSMQVNVEARFLSVAQDWFEQIGFDLDVVFNGENNQFRALANQNPGMLPTDMYSPQGRLLRNLEGPQTNLLVANQNNTGTIGTLTLPDGREIFTNLQAPTTTNIPGTLTPIPRPEQWSPVPALQNSLGLAETLGSVGFAGDILSSSPAFSMAATFLDDVQVDLLIKATQADRRTVTLTAPRLTVFNGQRSYIQVAVTEAFVSDLQPVTGDNAVGFDPEPSTVSSGIVLDVEATVSADRRYVTMHVDAQLAEVTGFRTVPVTATAGQGQIVTSDPNSAQSLSAPNQVASGFIELPEMQVSRVVTSVNVPDKGTVLLGGQRLVTEIEVETGVPVLSKIPVINRFFTNRISSKEESTLLILLRPQIIIQHEEEEKNFPGLLDSLRGGGVRY